MSREREWKLFNHPIRTTFRLTLAEQVYDALCREIHGGRWQIGDRLPGANTLAELSGLSHNVIQRALEQLREDGYVRQEKRKGTFLQSILPKGMKPKGIVGIAMTEREEGQNYHFDHVFLSRLHAVMKHASEIGYTTEALCLDENDEWEVVDRTDGPFGTRCIGIVSLHTFPRMMPYELADNQIPMVFLEAPRGTSQPSVCHDARYAIYQATRRTIAAGHRNIALYAGAPHPDCGLQIALEGFELACNEAGVSINRAAIEESIAHDAGDLVVIREWMTRHMDATAIISLTSAKARRIVSVCDVLGIRIPGDLSIVSQASAPMRVDDDSFIITGPKANMSRTVEESFRLLDELINTRRSTHSQIVLKPDFVEGHTLAAPRSGDLSIFLPQVPGIAAREA